MYIYIYRNNFENDNNNNKQNNTKENYYNMYSSLDDEPQRRKSQRGSVVAGLIFGIACWLMVSIMVNNNEDCKFRFLFALPFIGAVIGFVMINVISWESMDAQNAYQYTNPNVPCINRSVMIFGTLIALSCIGGSVAILVNWYAEPQFKDITPKCDPEPGDIGDGLLNVTSTVLVFISAWVMRLGNTPLGDDDY